MNKKLLKSLLSFSMLSITLTVPFLTSCAPQNELVENPSDELPNIPQLPETGNEDNNQIPDSDGSSTNPPSNEENGNQNPNDGESNTTTPPSNGNDSNQSGNDDVGNVDGDGNYLSGYDYFVIPGKDPNNVENRITNPFTKNEEVIQKYGNVPLPWKDDSKITKEDLVNMFTYLTLSANGVVVSFGERKIDSNIYNDAFFEWNKKIHKYFPYKTFDNPPPRALVESEDGKWTFPGTLSSYEEFNTDKFVNNTNWHLKKLNWTNYEDIYLSGTSREEYLEFITKLFQYIQPNMTDVEKFYLCSNLVMSWVKYCTNAFGPSFNDRGCCADYANMLSLALQLLDVPAVPVGVGYQAKDHAIVWVQLDLEGNGHKKWYAADPTWADIGTMPMKGIYATNPPYSEKSWILFDVAVDQFTSIDQTGSGGPTPYQHDMSNNLYGSPWRTVGQGTSTIGDVSYGSEYNYTYKYFNYFTNPIWELERSRTFFIGGYTYYFEKDASAKYGISLYKQKSVKNSSKIKVEIGLQDSIMEQFKFPTNDKNAIPMVQQVGNKIFIILNASDQNSSLERKVLSIQTTDDGINWQNYKEFTIPDSVNDLNQNVIVNFDIGLDGKLRIDYGKGYSYSTKTVFIDMGAEFKKEVSFSLENNNRKGDLDIAKQYFSALISMYRNGENRDGFLALENRKEFYQYMNQQANDNPYASIMNIFNKFKAIIKTTDVSSGELIQSELLNNLYIKETNSFNEYGFDFNGFKVYSNPSDMSNLSDIRVKYNIYYSKDKPKNSSDLDNFKKIIEESYAPFVTIDDLKKHGFDSGSGFYYLEIIKNNVSSTTNVCELKLTDNISNLVEVNLNYVSESNPANYNSKISNYDELNVNWSEEKIKFHFEVYYDSVAVPNEYQIPKVQLKHYNISTGVQSIIVNEEEFEQNYHIQSKHGFIGNITLDKPNDNNHGIYYIETTTRSTNSNNMNETIKSYSNFNFILTMNDFINWNKDSWVSAINQISIFKRKNY